MNRDPAVRPAYLVLVRSPRTAFATPFLSAEGARGRARAARRRGWRARVVEVDVRARDGTSLDPNDLPEPDVEDEGPSPRRHRRRTRGGRLLAAESSASATDVVDLNADQVAALTHTEPQEEPMSTTKATDEDLARAGTVALIEAASAWGVELPDPDPADLAPRATVDPGKLVGDAPHGWTVAAFAPLDGGARTLGVATVVATPGAARLTVAYVRARGWRAETRPHVVTDEAEVTSRER